METTAWYASKTLWGLVLTLVSIGLARWQINVPSDDAAVNSTIAIATGIAEVVGLAIAAYGRVKATGPIGAATTPTLPPPTV